MQVGVGIRGRFLRRMDQRAIVLALTAVLFIFFAVFAPGYSSVRNLISLLQSISIVGILGVGMGIVIIGRGFDFSMIAVLVMPVAWMFIQVSTGMPFAAACVLGLVFAVLLGLANGFLVAVVGMPPIFATLGAGTFFYGLFQMVAVSADIVQLPAALRTYADIAQGDVLGMPMVVAAFLVVAAAVALLLRFTTVGRFLYAIGDNEAAAAATGIPVAGVIILKYLTSAFIAFCAGVILAGTVNSVNTRLFNSTMIYDIILVVVLGGVSLAGGRGGVTNVLAGALLIGVLTNGMTIMNAPFVAQNFIKATILLLAIFLDSLINPRNEQNFRQGDL
jgi:ribose transport system permease protein